MSLLVGFEQRLERAVDGFFAKIFRSGVHPVEIGKRLLRVMEDGKTVALRRTYVPNSYTITLSKKDYERLAPLEHKLVEELEIFVSEAVRQRDWVLADTPRVSFGSAAKLGSGEFRIEAEAVALEPKRRRPARRPSVPPAAVPRTAEPTAPVRRPSAAGAALVVLDGGRAVKTVGINGRLRIGRQSDNELVVADAKVSRHHAEVVYQAGEYVLRDLGSTNGTIVNGEPVDEASLDEGDRLTIGTTVIEFRRSTE